MIRKVGVIILIGIVMLVYGEKTRKQGFENGLQLGKTRALRNEGYSLSEIHERLDSELF